MCRACRRYIQRGYSNETEDAKWLVERQTLEDFVKAVVSHSSVSIRSILERIHSIVVPQKRTGLRLQGPGIFKQLADVMHVSSVLSTRQAKHRVTCFTVQPVAQLKGGDRQVWSVPGAFAKLLKATISQVMSVRMEQSRSHSTDFHET